MLPALQTLQAYAAKQCAVASKHARCYPKGQKCRHMLLQFLPCRRRVASAIKASKSPFSCSVTISSSALIKSVSTSAGASAYQISLHIHSAGVRDLTVSVLIKFLTLSPSRTASRCAIWTNCIAARRSAKGRVSKLGGGAVLTV